MARKLYNLGKNDKQVINEFTNKQIEQITIIPLDNFFITFSSVCKYKIRSRPSRELNRAFQSPFQNLYFLLRILLYYLHLFVIPILYIYAIHGEKLDESNFSWITTIPIAHRGLDNGDVPENSMESFKKAIEKVLKINVVELKTDPQLMGALGAAEYARQKGLAKEN